MAKRSPILGYNHNISHRGLVFHVQTEDSGVDHPHIFTHLFYGGVIINTRKLDYDSSAAEESVKSLMQAQHKSILKLLKRGEFDEKITRYFGDNPDLQPAKGDAGKGAATAETKAEGAGAPPAAAAKAADGSTGSGASDVSAAFEAIQEDEQGGGAASATAPPPPEAAPAAPRTGSVDIPRPQVASAQAPAPRSPSGTYSKPKPGITDRMPAQSRTSTPALVHDQPTMPVQRARPVSARPAGKVRSVAERQGEAGRRSAPSVVVSRPAVIIGAPSKVVGGAKGQPAPARARPRRFAREEATGQGLFGKDMISEKSLDEVILAYLSDDSNEE